MSPDSKRSLFGISIVMGMGLIVAVPVYQRMTEVPEIAISALTPTIAISGQLQLDQLAQLHARGFATVIDVRPDGEEKDQPASAAVELAAKASKLHFAYIPVPHGEISDATVEALNKALLGSPARVLVYCRQGRRAARAWGLAEASRFDGRDAATIIATIKASGHSADDLETEIKYRIGRRSNHPRDIASTH
ncbi:MAG: TIGR01244 family sulfur transferase [Pseudomonadota bacterium]